MSCGGPWWELSTVCHVFCQPQGAAPCGWVLIAQAIAGCSPCWAQGSGRAGTQLLATFAPRAPAGIVPGGSEVRYEVQLLRLSRRGPDALMAGISQCGAGFANERTSGCADIEPAEFL